MKRMSQALVPSLVAYAVGFLAIGWGIWREVTALDDASAPATSLLRPVLLGLLAMAVGVWLALRGSASDPPDRSEEAAHASPSGADVKLALGLWALPIVVAWIQFELLLEVVWMFPMITLMTGLWLGAVVGQSLAPLRRSRAGAIAGLVVLGIPAWLLGFYGPMRYFNAHLTEVRTLALHDDLDDDWEAPHRRYQRFSAELPPFPELPPAPPLPMFEVSEPVDLETLMKDGDVVLRDGELYTRQADGSLLPMDGAADALSAAFADEAEARAEREREAVREAQREWKEELERRRRGGRLFSTP